TRRSSDLRFLAEGDKEYQTTARWPADESRKLEWAIEALLQGRSKALELARVHGQRDWDEIVAQSDSEMRAMLPSDWNEFQEQLEDRSIDLHELARYFDVAKECLCGEELIEFDDFIDAVQEHYGLGGDASETSY